MRPILTITLALLACTPAMAAPQDPVKNVLSAASSIWDSNSTAYQDIFSDERLASIYSRAFASSYRDAWKRASEDDEGIFDMDVIVHADDACVFENLTLTDEPADGKVTIVHARFNAFGCANGGRDSKRVTALTFKVISEGGRDVIDDIVRIDDGGKHHSIRQEIDHYGR
jgi:hypothetical protein